MQTQSWEQPANPVQCEKLKASDWYFFSNKIAGLLSQLDKHLNTSFTRSPGGGGGGGCKLYKLHYWE